MLLGHRSWVVVSCPAVLCVSCSLLSLSERRGDSNSVDNTFSCGLLASRLNCRMMGRYGPGRSNCIFLKEENARRGIDIALRNLQHLFAILCCCFFYDSVFREQRGTMGICAPSCPRHRRMDLFEPCYSHASGGSGSLVSVQFGLKMPILLHCYHPNRTILRRPNATGISCQRRIHSHTHTQKQSSIE